MSLGLTLSRKSVETIISFEISSDAYYNAKYTHPIWPGGDSGVTIGVGYDLGYNSPIQIKIDWGNLLSANDIELLTSVAFFKGEKARAALSKVKSVTVSLQAAKEVFFKRSIISYSGVARTTYPGIENLHPDAQGALVSLVYNRGGKIDNTDRRKEMKAIVKLVAEKNYAGIAYEIRSMKRLWNPATAKGLIIRRELEAQLVEKSNRNYISSELIKV